MRRSLSDKMDKVYRDVPLEKIPWARREKLPEFLDELIRKGSVFPCRSLEFGCGVGNDAIDLAIKGFDVTGIDASPAAIKIARRNLKEKSAVTVNCRFIIADAVNYLRHLNETFDFVYDRGLLHMLSLGEKKQYLKLIPRILNSNGRYFSGCFTDKLLDSSVWSRRISNGAYVYVSTANRLIALFDSCFEIIETRDVERKPNDVASHFTYIFMRKKQGCLEIK